ncbi:GldG family protein [Konateibacter massiliensis]|uniref:GldG family protein n=1 Tax=Konateibacter massiliensis TaxID=2002841 RepID=UPI000C150838|nr:GldG family protein [Konateibacter massiliensis]
MKIIDDLKNKGPKEPKFINKKSLRNGSYSMAVTALVLAIIVIVNLVINNLPSTYTKFDLSDTQLFSISEETTSLLGSLEDDVTIYLVAQTGNEDSTIVELLDKYKALSSSIKVEYKDPVLYPNFLSGYTTDQLNENSLVVESAKRSKVVDYSDIFQTTTDYTTYESTTEFDGEGQLTSAIDFVTSDNLPVVYALEGHNEQTLSSDLQEQIEKQNITVETLSLMTNEAVPEDCACLLIYSPLNDISTEEADKITAYLNGGGDAFIVSGYQEEELPNLDNLLATLGVEKTSEIVFEGDSNYYAAPYNHYLAPMLDSHEITSPLSTAKERVLLPYALGIKQLDTKAETISIVPLLSTTDSAYGKLLTSETSTTEKQDGDTDGPFDLSVAITNTIDDSTESKVILTTSDYLMDDSANKTVAGGNHDFILNSFNWLTEHESGITIHSKSMDSAKLVLSAAQVNFWSFVAMILLPLAVVVTGIVVWLRRRKK